VGNKEHAAHVVYISKAKLNQLEEHCTSKSISKSRLATRRKEEKELIHEERLHTYFAHEDYELRSHSSDKIFRLLARLRGQLKEKYFDYATRITRRKKIYRLLRLQHRRLRR
jgi:hypothetical protein